MLWTYFIIFILAAIPLFEVAAIVPLAVIGGLPPVPVIIVAFLGNFLTIALLILFIDRFRNWYNKRKKGKGESKGQKRAKSIWGKFGLPGLALIGPFFVGTHVTAILAITFGGTRKATFILMTISIAFWAILLGTLAALGFDFMIADDDNLGVITRLLNN